MDSWTPNMEVTNPGLQAPPANKFLCGSKSRRMFLAMAREYTPPKKPVSRGLHSFPFPHNLSLLCPPYVPN